jgi:hypothetical protein
MTSPFHQRNQMADDAVARALGVASIGIGLSEILAPRKLEKAMGIGNGRNTGILRILGVREVMHGIDILFHEDPTPGVRARVFGDVLDSVLLGMAGTRTKKPGSFATIAAMVAGIGLLDLVFAGRLGRDRGSR